MKNMSDSSCHHRAHLLFDPAELAYSFGPQHPFQSDRLLALMDLLESSGLWSSQQRSALLPLRAATEEELQLIHSKAYVAAVQQLSTPLEDLMSKQERREWARLAATYGFDEADIPAIADMHEAASLISGGTLVALSAIMGLPEGGAFSSEEQRPLHVFHPAGGLHHAWPERASGFCIYNDIAVAISHVLQASEAKVLYLDFDAHHGDGVQRAFYDDPRVMTISLHETGRYLFPGTGEVLEVGQGLGRGSSVNVPLEPFTQDESYREVMQALLPPLVASFAPDVIVSLHGCDTHSWDPLTHLELTMRGIEAQIQLAHQLAHTYCQGRWLALGGGGYDRYRVVPRAWGMLWAQMSEQPLPVQLPPQWVARWRDRWLATQAEEEAEQRVMGKTFAHVDFPTTFEDQAEDFPRQPREAQIRQANRRTATQVRQLLLPPPLRQAFPLPRLEHHSPLEGIYDRFHLRDRVIPSRMKTLETPKGPIFLRDACPPSLIERLKAEEGLHSFARLPEREHELLLSIARSPDCELTIAHTPGGEIIGQVTLTPGDEWFDGLDNAYEITIEVSSHWRGLGLAHQLLAFALQLETLEEVILFAMGLSWHWDTEGLHITPHHYRQMLAQLFASQGFVEYATAEPNIRMEPANILLARIGRRVPQQEKDHFIGCLLHPSSANHFEWG
jgi:acetoin utilization deacetylase AcuC-like enzyme